MACPMVMIIPNTAKRQGEKKDLQLAIFQGKLLLMLPKTEQRIVSAIFRANKKSFLFYSGFKGYMTSCINSKCSEQ